MTLNRHTSLVGSSVVTLLFTYLCGKVHIFVFIYVDDLLITESYSSFLETLISSRRNSP